MFFLAHLKLKDVMTIHDRCCHVNQNMPLGQPSETLIVSLESLTFAFNGWQNMKHGSQISNWAVKEKYVGMFDSIDSWLVDKGLPFLAS